MTLAELVTEMSREYPSTVEVNTRVAFLNQALVEMEDYFDNYAIASFTTVADTDEYALPTGIEDVSQIYSIGISNNIPPKDRYDYVRYQSATAVNYFEKTHSFYQLTDSDGDKKIIIYPVPNITGKTVSVTYRKHFVPLAWTTNTASPEFDSRYHILLVYYADHMIASSGHAPDTLQADMFMQKWIDGLKDITEKKLRESANLNMRNRDNKQWHASNRHVAGTVVPLVEV